MSDKTKYYADQAQMARRMAATPRQEGPALCPCGEVATLTGPDADRRQRLYCRGCAPEDLLALFAGKED